MLLLLLALIPVVPPRETTLATYCQREVAEQPGASCKVLRVAGDVAVVRVAHATPQDGPTSVDLVQRDHAGWHRVDVVGEDFMNTAHQHTYAFRALMTRVVDGALVVEVAGHSVHRTVAAPRGRGLALGGETRETDDLLRCEARDGEPLRCRATATAVEAR